MYMVKIIKKEYWVNLFHSILGINIKSDKLLAEELKKNQQQEKENSIDLELANILETYISIEANRTIFLHDLVDIFGYTLEDIVKYRWGTNFTIFEKHTEHNTVKYIEIYISNPKGEVILTEEYEYKLPSLCLEKRTLLKVENGMHGVLSEIVELSPIDKSKNKEFTCNINYDRKGYIRSIYKGDKIIYVVSYIHGRNFHLQISYKVISDNYLYNKFCGILMNNFDTTNFNMTLKD